MMDSLALLDKLYEYECTFLEEMESRDVVILRDIGVSKVQLAEITKYISNLFKVRHHKALEIKYPITTSIFLVWTAVYEYKDGDFWSKIFEKINIPHRTKYQSFFGEIFVKTITKYNLQTIDSNDGKKYLSPILMHGLISDYYSDAFFSYLNKVYSIILKEDVSKSDIDNIWPDVFECDEEKNSLEEEIKLIIERIADLQIERNEYDVANEILEIDKTSLEKQENYIDDLLAKIILEESDLETESRKMGRLNELLSYYNEFDTSLLKLKGFKSNILDNERIQAVREFSIEFGNELSYQVSELESKIKILKKDIRKTENRLKIEDDKFRRINMDIATIGKGSLEEGWYIIERCKEIDLELLNLERILENKKSLAEVSQGFKNTTLKQILTSSLNHLFNQNPQYFKDFIIGTFQVMDAIYKSETGDLSYPLYNRLTEWHESYKEEHIAVLTPIVDEKSEEDKPKKKRTGNIQRLQLPSLNKPRIKLDTHAYDLIFFIPEQSFNYDTSIQEKPKYSLINNEGNERDLLINTYTEGKSIFIKELNIPIRKYEEQIFMFKFFNLKESYSLELQPAMLFNYKGEYISNNKLYNGLYYVLCDSNWSSDFSGILDIKSSGVEGYSIYEIQLNENKAVFRSIDNIEIEYLGSNLSNAYLTGLNIVEGLTADDVKVSMGDIPNLSIGLRDIDPTNSKLKIFLDDGLIFERTLRDLMSLRAVQKDDLLMSINLNNIIKRDRKTFASKLKILLINGNGYEIFNEEFWSVLMTRFIYKSESLEIKLPLGSRIKYKESTETAREYLIKLDNDSDERFSIYYKMVGWIEFKVEVPKVNITFSDGDGKLIDLPRDLLLSKLDILREVNVTWETSSMIPKTIYIYDDKKSLEARLHLRKGKATASLYSYYDILESTIDETSLKYKWIGDNRGANEESIINIFRQWQATNIKCYQKEEEDEYIIELIYDSNFDLQAQKFLKIYNDGLLIIQKNIKENQMYIYINKKDIKSSLINIEIVYLDEIDDLFEKGTKEVIAGEVQLELISKINQLSLIKKYGIKATGFKYKGDYYKFKDSFIIDKIQEAKPINFIKEELYTGQAIIKDQTTQVIFYINMEKVIMPFLLDEDRDGVQYHPLTGEVFWESRSGKEIMGPIEDISYEVKED